MSTDTDTDDAPAYEVLHALSVPFDGETHATIAWPTIDGEFYLTHGVTCTDGGGAVVVNFVCRDGSGARVRASRPFKGRVDVCIIVPTEGR